VDRIVELVPLSSVLLYVRFTSFIETKPSSPCT
jgi:hypothetical protein